MKIKPQQCYKFIKTLLQTENEGRLGFELWPRFADFARFFCAFALNSFIFTLRSKVELNWTRAIRHVIRLWQIVLEKKAYYAFSGAHIFQKLCQNYATF